LFVLESEPMILTDRQITEARARGDITIEPFDEKQIQPASYDLRVGDQGITTSSKKKVDIKAEGYLLVHPGDFAVVVAHEEIRLGTQYTARFGIRSKYARRGLVATTGLQIDPGYHGRLIVGITNLTPKAITLPHLDDFLSVEFHHLSEPAQHPYSGPYQGRVDLGPEEIEFITESEGMALSEVLNTLRSLSANVGTLTVDVTALTTEMKHYKWVIPVLLVIGMAVIGTIVAIK
jgi:dCTP deaminase